MKTLKEKVRDAVLEHRSGAIEVYQIVESSMVGSHRVLGGHCSVSYDDLEQFAQSELGGLVRKEVGRFQQETPDYYLELGLGVIQPLTEACWTRLEEICSTNPNWCLKPDTTDAAFSGASCFRGLLDVKHDFRQICREQREAEKAAEEGGYGKSAMGGWIEYQ